MLLLIPNWQSEILLNLMDAACSVMFFFFFSLYAYLEFGHSIVECFLGGVFSILDALLFFLLGCLIVVELIVWCAVLNINFLASLLVRVRI